MLKVISPHHFLLHISHQPSHNLSQIHLILSCTNLHLAYLDTLATLVLNYHCLCIFLIVVLCKHLSC